MALYEYVRAAIFSVGTLPNNPIYDSLVAVNPDVNQGTVPEDLWPLGGVYVFPTVSSVLQVMSSSASDTAAGIGARTIKVSGLNNLYEPVTETFTLNGLTVVTGLVSFFRVNHAQVITTGSSEVNVGNITIRTPSLNTLSYIESDTGQSRQAIYTVRNNYVAVSTYIHAAMVSGGQAKDYAIFQLRSKVPGGSWITNQIIAPRNEGLGQIAYDPIVPVPFEAKTDIKIRVTYVDANNLFLSGSIQFLLWK